MVICALNEIILGFCLTLELNKRYHLEIYPHVMAGNFFYFQFSVWRTSFCLRIIFTTSECFN
uniref:Uncharacterized protein n=1 Tax=Rhizophora mucronata TaxID=61149 RepID=A0A2P2LFE6_RHIMU